MPARPIPPRASSSRPKPCPSSSISALTSPGRRTSSTLTRCAPACLAMFVSASCTIRYRVVSTSGGNRSAPSCDSNSTEIPVASVNVSTSRSSAATRPKSSSAFGRNSTASLRTSCSVATTSSRRLASAAGASAAVSTALRPSSTEVSAWPVSSCSSRASRRRSSSCPSITRRSESRCNATRKIDRNRRTLAEVLGESQVRVREPRIARRRSCANTIPIGPSPASSGHIQSVVAPNWRTMSCTTSGSSITASTRSLRPRARTAPAFDSRVNTWSQQVVRLVRGDRLDPQPVGDRQSDRDEARVDQLAQPFHDELQQPRQVELTDQRSADLAATTRAGATTRSPTRRGVRSRSRRPPGPRAAPRAPRPRR